MEGAYLGDGTQCTPTTCATPVMGACCREDGTCQVLSPGSCDQLGGEYQGDDTLCGPQTCVDPTGACCMEPGGPQTRDIVLTVDVSGSIDQGEREIMIDGLKAALASEIPQDGTHRVAIVAFDHAAIPILETLTPVNSVNLATIIEPALDMLLTAGGGGTSIAAGLNESRAILTGPQSPSPGDFIMLLGDGADYSPDVQEACEAADQAGITICSIAVDSDPDGQQILMECALATGGEFGYAPTFEDLPPVVASCLNFISGDCLELTEPECADQGGEYVGNGTTCEPGTCQAICGGDAGLDCEVPGEYCQYPDGTCDEPAPLGICLPIPNECSPTVDPVCGCDGNTYDNRCLAEQAEMSVAYEGECSYGACCFQSGTCAEGAEPDCEASFGDFQGNGTECASVECEPVDICDPDYIPQPGDPEPLLYCDPVYTEQMIYPLTDMIRPQICTALNILGAGGLCPDPEVDIYAETKGLNFTGDLRMVVYLEGGQRLTLRPDPPDYYPFEDRMVYASLDGGGLATASGNEEAVGFIVDQVWAFFGEIFDVVSHVKTGMSICKGIETALDPCHYQAALRDLRDMFDMQSSFDTVFCQIELIEFVQKIYAPVSFGNAGDAVNIMIMIVYYDGFYICDWIFNSTTNQQRNQVRAIVQMVIDRVGCPTSPNPSLCP